MRRLAETVIRQSISRQSYSRRTSKRMTTKDTAVMSELVDNFHIYIVHLLVILVTPPSIAEAPMTA